MKKMKNNTAFVFAIVTSALLACKNNSPSPDATEKPKQEEAKTEAPEVKVNSMEDQESLPKAIEFSKNFMSDTTNEVSDGAILLAKWSVDNMKWNDLQAIPQAKSFNAIMKDSDKERGKLLCQSGSIIEITAAGRMYEGGLFTSSGNVIRFIAVGNTGDLVARSSAKFCGIVIGKQDYSNSAGGVAHAVYLVGMFNLPENK